MYDFFWLIWELLKRAAIPALDKNDRLRSFELYREEGTLPIGPVNDLSNSVGSTSLSWDRHGPFVTILYIDEDEGSYTATFETGYWYTLVGFASGLFAVWISFTHSQPFLHYWLGTACLILSFIPLYPPAPISNLGFPNLHADTQNVTNLGVVPLGGGLLVLWPVSNGLIQLLLLATACILGAGYVARNITPTEKTEMMRFAMVLVGVLPIFLTALWLVALTTIPARSNRLMIVTISLCAVLGSLGSILFVGRASRQALQGLIETDTTPIKSPMLRDGWLFLGIVVVSISNALLAVIVIELLAYFEYITFQLGVLTEPLARIATGMPGLRTGMVLFVLFLVAPLLLQFALWLAHLVHTSYHRFDLFRQARAVSNTELGFTPDRSVYQTDLANSAAVSVPCWTRLEAVIIFDKDVINELDPEHIRVIYEHESYHINRGHPWVIDLLSLFAPLFGGANGVLAYWLPSIDERAADQRAATAVGTQITIQALREVEQIRRQQTVADTDRIPGQLSKGLQQYLLQSKAVKLCRAMYGLFFSGITIQTAHESVDDRIVALTED